MQFFLEFLNNFSASEILYMYGEGAFRTSEEIKVADFAISFKVIFDDHHISSEDLKIYMHMQKVVDAIRAHQFVNRSISSSAEECCNSFCLEEVHFNYFIKYSEIEKEVERYNVFERRMVFELKAVRENVSSITWLEEALDELLTYVLRNFEETDRVGMVIKYEECHERNATFPIRLKNQLMTSILLDTLTSMLRTKGSLITGRRMCLQAVRIRLPVFYRKLTPEDVLRTTGSDMQLAI